MAANLGGRRLSQICEEIQSACQAGEHHRAQACEEKLRTASVALKTAMEQIDWAKFADEHRE
jgi:HPt (histidine-containing phosphotransfer) domain-containing protein